MWANRGAIGNTLAHDKLGLLFVRWDDAPKKLSIYAPRAEHEPPIPDWKRNPTYRDALPERGLAALAEE